MIRFVLTRLAQSFATLLILTLIVFLMGRMAGNPAVFMLPAGEATRAEVQALEERMGLDKPLYVQFARYVVPMLRGDLGQSTLTGRPVADRFFERFPATLQLTVLGMAIALGLGIPAGVVSALKRGGLLDRAVRVFTSLGQSVPDFWMGLMFILVFAIWLGVLPAAGRNGWEYAILPAVTMSLFSLSAVTRLTRSAMLAVLNEQYIVFARAKGVTRRIVIFKHALRNALIPVATFSGVAVVNQFLVGAIAVEVVFAWPGVGLLGYQSVLLRDLPTLQGVVLIFGAMFIIANLLVDIAYGYLDPRIRVTRQG